MSEARSAVRGRLSTLKCPRGGSASASGQKLGRISGQVAHFQVERPQGYKVVLSLSPGRPWVRRTTVTKGRLPRRRWSAVATGATGLSGLENGRLSPKKAHHRREQETASKRLLLSPSNSSPLLRTALSGGSSVGDAGARIPPFSPGLYKGIAVVTGSPVEFRPKNRS